MSNTPDIQDRWPFLTIISYLKIEYVGIVQNADANFISMYLLNQNYTDQMKQEFLECGEDWWYESNRAIPINLFLRSRFEKFKPFLRVFARKECTILSGPTVNVSEMNSKRIKRRTIILVKSDE